MSHTFFLIIALVTTGIFLIQFVLSIFFGDLVLSGMCLNFSGNGIKRGVLLNLAGFAVTCVTVIAEPNQAVWLDRKSVV